MKSRLFRSSLLLFLIPCATVLLSFSFWGWGLIPLELLLLGTLTQLLAILHCRKRMEPLFRPAARVLNRMGVARVPVPYEPGKFRTDFRLASVFMWTGLPVPGLLFLARGWAAAHVSPMARSAGPSVSPLLPLIALGLILLGSLSFALWVKFGQASVIFSEPGEQNRYLYRGFADEVNSKARCRTYLDTCRSFR